MIDNRIQTKTYENAREWLTVVVDALYIRDKIDLDDLDYYLTELAHALNAKQPDHCLTKDNFKRIEV